MILLMILASISAFFAILTLVMITINLLLFKGEAPREPTSDDLVSVCIPARNEESNIEACVRSLLSSTHSHIEVLVYDDESTDATPRILQALADKDSRVRRVPTHPLPSGWNGKQHACSRMGEAAQGAWLLFTDADVRFEPTAVSAGLACAESRQAALVSTFPRQIVRSLGEMMTVPTIFFLLLGYLPFPRMRNTNDPAAAAGCGQYIFAKTSVYRELGGHEVCRDSMHDGIMLPRAFRRARHRTDLFNGTEHCSVRMYHGWRESWAGFTKNAYEGLGSLGLLVFLTVVHLLSHIAPWFALPVLVITGTGGSVTPLLAVAVLAGFIQRLMLTRAFRHPSWLALAHPFAILVLTGVQWHSYILDRRGTRTWKGRTHTALASSPA